MEAASIPWRPLGRILVEQGLLTSEELETALARQEKSGRRLGETIVECGFVSGPELSSALASQYGIELTTETGFGTGLRSEIQRRHESERRSVRPVLVEVAPLHAPDEAEPESEPATSESSLLAQLEEQWAKLAAAEALLAERELELTALVRERDRRRGQAVRFARRARRQNGHVEGHADELRRLEHVGDRLRAQVERLAADVRGCDEEIARLRHENEGLRDELAAAAALVAEHRELEHDPQAAPAEASSHLVFVQLADRYELVERDGPPPPRNAALELPELGNGALVVAGLRRSPLPGDMRPCVVAEPAGELRSS
ncbi:MAG: hypothetical protein H0V45_06355 [Actinobacteria bacterium]|nr:hypothetical protein [Actinomycetota bacterium]